MNIDSLLLELSKTIKKLIHIQSELELYGLSNFNKYAAAKTLLEMALEDLEIESNDIQEERIC